jgi:sulfur carrier protein ThiS
MKIVLRLHATLRDYLPEGTDTKGAILELAEGATIPDALAVLGVPLAQAHIVLIGARHVLKPDLPTRKLREGDELVVFPAIGGG